MGMIIDVRGTHGSGKSWVVQRLLSRLEDTYELIWGLPPELASKRKKDIQLGRVYARTPQPLIVLGKYDDSTQCPGCDRIPSGRLIPRLARESAEWGDVLMEGIIVSGSWRDYCAIAMDGFDYRWVFLDTTLETCIGQVNNRRKERGLGPVNEHNLRDHMKRQIRYRRYCKELGLQHWIVSSDDAVDLIAGWLEI